MQTRGVCEIQECESVANGLPRSPLLDGRIPQATAGSQRVHPTPSAPSTSGCTPRRVLRVPAGGTAAGIRIPRFRSGTPLMRRFRSSWKRLPATITILTPSAFIIAMSSAIDGKIGSSIVCQATRSEARSPEHVAVHTCAWYVHASYAWAVEWGPPVPECGPLL